METVSEVRTEHVPVSATTERMQAKPIATVVWNFLISMKLAIWILIVLAVTSILGTVIEQNQPSEKYHKVALARVTRGWHGTRAAILSIAGFLATVLCYLGVNLVLSGLHSYGG
jgi:hypothetical protein